MIHTTDEPILQSHTHVLEAQSVQLPPPKLISRAAILFDVDSTLTNLAREITPRTLTALKTAQQAQFRLGLCTGRQLAQLWNYVLPHFPAEVVHVVAGGGQVATSKGNILWESKLPSDVVRVLCEAAEIHRCGFGFGQGPIMYVNKPLLKRLQTDSWRVHAELPGAGLKDWSTPLLIVNHLNDPMRQILDATPDLEIKYMLGKDNIPYADITVAGITKAKGVAIWAELHGLQPTDCIGVGDGDNDIEFLESIGWAVAMKNAYPPVLAVADQVIGHADADGLAVFLEQLIQARRDMVAA